MTKLILTDIDETILDFTTAFGTWVTAQGHTAKSALRENYNLATTFGITDVEAIKLIEEFHHEGEGFANLAPEPCAALVLPRLYAAGYRFVAITACVSTPEIKEARVANLEKAFGFAWEDCHCVGLRGSKAEALARYEPTIWVEDNFNHALYGAHVLGHRTFLVERGYNVTLNDPAITRVKDWHEIEEAIT
jgi:FMN phosphatase YigB (HAD superfamily)